MPRTTKPATAKPSFEETLGALVAHPTRLRAWVILAEGVASPQQIAHELGLDVSHVGYHVRKLHQLGLIELVEERPVRGAVEHFYRGIAKPFLSEHDLEEATPEERDEFTRQIIQLIMADASLAIEAGTFDRRLGRWLVRQPLHLDDEGFDEMAAAEEKLYATRLEIQERVNERGGETFPVASASWFHEMPRRTTGLR